MRNSAQVVFDLVHVPCREAPIVIAQIVEARQSITFDSTRHVNVGIEVALNQLSQVTKTGPSSMQPNVSGAGDRTPAAVSMEHKVDVIEQVNRFYVQEQRWMAVLFPNHRGGHS